VSQTDTSHSQHTERAVRCLFIDDDPALLRGFARLLHLERPAWEVFCVQDGAAALGLLGSRQVDVVVTDLQMPTMNGITLLKLVKARHPATVRLVHSSHIETLGRDRVDALSHRVLAKPAAPALLLEALDWAVGVARQSERHGTD
jgi:CheY-like chemotaxis protein